jgi:MFS transporter, PPP family, 3-phenylpropionic acid transporter
MSDNARFVTQRISLLYAAVFMIFGVYLPFFPLWLAERGLSEAQIALVIGIPMWVRIVTMPIIGAAIDHWGDRRRALVILSALALVVIVPWSSLVPTVDAIGTTATRRGLAPFGRMRLWGSVAFLAASVPAGYMIEVFGVASVLPMILGCLVIQLAVSFSAPQLAPVRSVDERRMDTVLSGMVGGVRELARFPGLVLLFIAAALAQGSHAMLYAFASLHWTSLGYSGGWIGLLWAIGVIAEIALFYVTGSLLRRFDPLILFMIGALGGVARFVLFPLTSDPYAMLGLQILHALSFGATYMGAMNAVARLTPERLAGTTQALMAAANGTALAIFTFVSGPLFTRFGGDAFFANAVIAGVAGLLAGYAYWGAARITPRPSP